jgi:hypothetical protein
LVFDVVTVAFQVIIPFGILPFTHIVYEAPCSTVKLCVDAPAGTDQAPVVFDGNAVVNCDEELIAPLNDVKNEPVSLSVIQLPLTLSIVFNLSTNDDVDCDAVYSLNEDVCNLAFIPFVNAVFNDDCEDVNEFKEVISIELLTNPNNVICADEDIVPAGIVVEELINPNVVICADELITLLPFISKEDVTLSKDNNLSLSNMFTLAVTASARVSNSIL